MWRFSGEAALWRFLWLSDLIHVSHETGCCLGRRHPACICVLLSEWVVWSVGAESHRVVCPYAACLSAAASFSSDGSVQAFLRMTLLFKHGPALQSTNSSFCEIKCLLLSAGIASFPFLEPLLITPMVTRRATRFLSEQCQEIAKL